MAQNKFLQKKQAILKALESTTDASPKGSVDALCWPLIRLINSYPKMVTTSSCSGRLSIFQEGVKAGRPGGKGDGGKWIFITHEKDKVYDWYKTLPPEAFVNSESITQENGNHNDPRLILFKFEPVIFHVQCEDFDTACELYKTAMGCGFRESGIGNNSNVAIRISVKIDAPIGVYDEKEARIKLFVDRGGLELMTRLAAQKFDSNKEKINKLYRAIEDIGKTEESKTSEEIEKRISKSETKQERRERKIREGLAHKAEMEKEKFSVVHN